MDYGLSHITARIYLGGQFESVDDADHLAAHNVTDVINCREFEDPDYVQQRFRCCWPNPHKPDDGSPRGEGWFAEGIDYALKALCAPKRIIYVHCHAGLNRSASMVYAILRSIGLSDLAAREMICQHRLIDFLGIRYAGEATSAVRALDYLPG